jgi:hypothetical protein
MSDRTHRYRQLGSRDPATTAQMYAVDPVSGLTVALQASPDGKLVVEGGGGGGGGGGVIQAKAPGASPDAPRVTVDLYATSARELLVAPKADSQVVLRGTVPAVAPVPDPLNPTGPPLVPGVPAFAVSIKATAAGEVSVAPKDDALVVLRGIVPEETIPGPLPGDPDIIIPAYAQSLRTNEEGELAVSMDAPVALEAVLSGSSPAAKVPLVADANGSLQVAIEASVTVPVEVQGVAEVKATSANFWAIAKGNGPVVIPGFTDSAGWASLRAFSRLSATGIGAGYTWDRADRFIARSGTVHRVSTYAELTAAITAATAGDTILLRDGTYEVPSGTLTVNKSLLLIGESRDGVVIQTPAQTAPGVNHVITISANDVEIRNLTVYHRQTATSAAGAEACVSVAAGTVGTVIDTCRVLYMEFGLVMRGQFSVRSCEIEYAPTAPVINSTYRAIGIYGIVADSEIVDVTAKFISTNTPRFIWLGSVTGTTYAGTLTIARCTLGAGYVHQWVEIPSLPGTPGAFNLAMLDNVFDAGNAGIIFSGSSNSDVLNSVTLARNSVGVVPKGLFGTNGSRTLPLTVHVAGNISSQPNTLLFDYISLFADWAVVARDTVNTQYTVIGDDIIPDLGIPAETGASVLIGDNIAVDVTYRVSMEEPHEHVLGTATLSGVYHQIINPEEPKDILGIGHVRLLARASTDLGGHFAVFGVAK